MNKTANLIVIGGSLGGCLAAFSACKSGKTVIMTESTDWIGGQLTSQAVPPDEHKWIESQGCTATYREYRNKIREHYRQMPDIIDELKSREFFCPGGSSVSRLAHPPKLALAILSQMLQPFVQANLLEIMLNTHAVNASMSGDEIASVTVKSSSGEINICKGKYYLDATDIGELIELSGAEYTSGAEPKELTGERHASSIGDRLDMQPITWVGAVDWDSRVAADCVMDKPLEYEYFKSLQMPYDQYKVLSMFGPDSSSGKAKQFGFWNGEKGEQGQNLFGLFSYRRIEAAHHFKGDNRKDITLINWPQNDYFMDNIFLSRDDEHNLYMSRQLTLSLIYWLQTEATRADGGKGYRGLGLRGDVLGTTDGLAKYPYIRESRRIKALTTITETMISKSDNAAMPDWHDSVGVGSYHIDLHITTRSNSFFFDEAHPFQIPLGAMIPQRITNLIPACKNIGTTHLTNGCYRLHPIEWNVGEVAGYLAAFSISNNVLPRQVYLDKKLLKSFQELLISQGIQLKWQL